MNFEEYQKKSRKTAIYPNADNNFIYPTLGLAGEAGEVAEKIKKVIRDKKGVIDEEKKKEIEKELEHNFHTVLQLEKEHKQLQPWGDFDWELVDKLKEQGITTRFLLCPVKKFQPEWEENYYIKVI